MILKVGLTGGIASGKSTVARTLARLGCFVVDADAVVGELYRPGAPGHRAILARYGPEILGPDGEIDRPLLSRIALSDQAGAAELGHLIHPLVATRVEQIVAEEEARVSGRDWIVVVEATLLFEAGTRPRYDRIVVVDVDPETQIRRAVDRGLSEEEARRRLSRQMSRDERRRFADYVIETGGDLAATEAASRRLHESLLRDLQAKKSAD